MTRIVSILVMIMMMVVVSSCGGDSVLSDPTLGKTGFEIEDCSGELDSCGVCDGSGPTTWYQDSDGDGLTDGEEVNTYKTKPLVVDSDGDGLSDEVEVNTHKSNPLLTDSDGDSMPDAQELKEGSSPIDDSDCPRWYCGGLSPGLMKLP